MAGYPSGGIRLQNVDALGSIPALASNCPRSLEERRPPSKGYNAGSNPAGGAIAQDVSISLSLRLYVNCKQCGGQIPNWAKVEGRSVNLQNRRYCLVCSPYGARLKNRKTGDIKTCSRCMEPLLLKEFYPRRKMEGAGNLSPWCRACYRKDAAVRSKSFKEQCVQYKGGSCIRCGYSKYSGALEFHHRDPSQKDFGLAQIHTRRWSEKIEAELDKCDLLCANCHREVHGELENVSVVELDTTHASEA